jgi:hypothetical protein
MNTSRGRKKGSESVYKLEFSKLIKELLGLNVIPVTGIREDDKRPLEFIKSVARSVLRDYGTTGEKYFVANRPNDISDNVSEGKSLEDVLVEYSKNMTGEFKVDKFRERVGYPNLRISKDDNVVCYVDVKVTARGKRGSARDIYISPGPPTNMSVRRNNKDKIFLSFEVRKGYLYKKVDRTASHIILLFRAVKLGNNRWKLQSCSIYDISKLNMKVKVEFNASFRDLTHDLMLGEVVSS